MDCPETRVAAFVSGELAPEEAAAFDGHLLECEECWQAVREDRLGRSAAAQLRIAAPSDLEDRIRFAISVSARVESGSQARIGHRSSRLRLALVGVTVALAAIGTGIGFALSGGTSANPAQIAAVMTMVQQGRSSPALLTGEQLVIGGQQMSVRAYMVEGVEVVAATSPRSFAMPSGSRLVSGSSERAWMASSGPISLYGVNGTAAGDRSMFVVATMPMTELPGIAARLKLI